MKDIFLSSFTPSLMSSKDLEAIFVQREKLAKDLIAGIKESATTENKHYRLLVGMRGIGKTHTIALVYHRLRNEADLENKLLIAWLKEEEWGISSWLDLIMRIFRALDDLYPEEYQDKLATEVEALYELPPEEATIKGEIILKEFVNNRTLLLLAENLDEIFKGLGDKGQKKFRAYLQNNNFITIVATSQSLFNGVTNKKSPFYGFFNPHNLDKLSIAEATNLLDKIAELKQDEELAKFIKSQTGQDRIKAIHHLAAGNHRVYIIFSQFLTRNSLDDLVQPVMQTLDELTPYYQARMQWLSPQQRKIIELLCDRRDAVPVKEIAQRCFISHQTASSQLKDLLTKGYVEKESQGRESFYELQEPLMRICLEVKKQRGEPIKLFIDFLRIWYTNHELEERLKQLPNDCLEKIYILEALEIEPIYEVSIESYDSKQLNNLLQEIIISYKKENYKTTLHLCERYLKINPDNYKGFFNLGTSLYKLDRHEEAIESFDHAIKINSNYYKSWNNRGAALYKLDRHEEAIKSFDHAIKINPNDYRSWNYRGTSLYELDRHEEAIESFDHAIKINPDDYKSWNYRGAALYKLDRHEEAIKSFDHAIKINPDDYKSWNYRGTSLYELDRHEEAIESFDNAIKINPDDYKSWGNKGIVLIKVNHWKEGFDSISNSLNIAKITQNLSVDNTDTQEIIKIIFEANKDFQIWQGRITILVELYNKHQLVSALGKGLTENIPKLISEIISNKEARTWLEVWQEVAGDKPELEISLRWLKTAVEYKETKGDRKTLFQLPKEERELFVTLLEDKKE